MIVTLTFPSGIERVAYGAAGMMPDKGTLDVPDYVAKSLLTLSGVTGPSVVGTVPDLMAADADYELNYMFLAYGVRPPMTDVQAQAQVLFTARGEPPVSMS